MDSISLIRTPIEAELGDFKELLIVLSPVQMHCSIASYLTYGRGMVR